MAAGRKKATRKKTARKKTTRKKAARKKTARKKTTRKKAARKKTARKKTTRKKAARKKTARKKTTRKKAARKKTARKKTTRKKTARKKTARKKTARKKTARKKATAKKTAPKKTARAKTGRRKEVAAPAPSVPGDGGPSAESTAPASAQDPESAKIAASTPTRIGVVTHYFGRAGAGVICIESGELRVGDVIHVRGHTTDFYERVHRMEIDHVAVEVATPGQSVGVEISQRVREHDEVFRVSD